MRHMAHNAAHLEGHWNGLLTNLVGWLGDSASCPKICGSTVTGTPIYGPEPGLVTVYTTTTDGQRRPDSQGHSGDADCPIQISDSDETTLADDEAEPALVTDDESMVSDGCHQNGVG